MSTGLTRTRCTRCGVDAQPILEKGEIHLGAYCANCKAFIQWVPQNTLWNSLYAEQQLVTTPTLPPDIGASIYFGVPSRHDDPLFATMVPQAIGAMARACFVNSEALGFHDGPKRSVLELAMLVVTELSELVEAARHGTLNDPSEHIPEYSQAEEEWADCLVRVLDHSVEMGVDPVRLGQAFVTKLAFNRTRGYRHGGKTI